MSLEELKKSLVQEAKAEAAKITSLAEKEAGETVAAAKAKADKIKASAMARARQAVLAERNERLGSAQLRSKKMVSEAKNRVIEKAIAKIWGEFEAVPKNRPEYEKLMKKLISRAEKELGKEANVSVNSRDIGLANRVAKNVSKETAGISGGAIVTNKGGKVSIDCSLESIFSQNNEKLRKLVYYELFGKGRG